MTREEFIEQLKEGIVNRMGDYYDLDVTAEIITVTKTNAKMDELSVRVKGSRISPAIPVDPLYEDYTAGTSVEALIVSESDRLYRSIQDYPELPTLAHDEAMKHVSLALVNTELNTELLKDTPHFEICGGELSAIPRWYISEEASFIVKNNVLSDINMTPDEILQIGQDNINAHDFKVINMADLIAEMTGERPEGSSMIVLTTDSRIHGAKAMLSEKALQEVHDRIGDFFILPSSIHEVICVPAEGADPDVLRSMVRDVNETQVAIVERLSDNVFSYDGRRLSLVADTVKIESPEVSMRMAM